MANLKQLLGTVLLLSSSMVMAGQTTLTEAEVAARYNATYDGATPRHVTVHDPSIVIGYEGADGKVTGVETSGSKKVYCVFGSHRAWAKSYDLVNWETFENNISSDYATIFADDASWSALGSKSYDVSGNLWAPDVIWNRKTEKWCMYMSVNGDYFYSSIVLLTAESLTGDWTREGTVVYSFGLSSKNESKTDMWDVLESGSDTSDRYYWCRNSTKNRTYGMNAIDPCVFYDEDGNLWMTYGSWFGGMYIMRLDETTGLRDKTYTYETSYKQKDANAAWNQMNIVYANSDAYQGIKIAGGNHVSGEASYVEYHDGRYWLFVTYGGLTATGGYNMRVFSSESVTGPYTDISGDDARYSNSGEYGSANAGQVNRSVGTRLMSYYRWGFMDYGYVAQGHNSAVVDGDRMWLVYHTRFDDGTEGHQVRVHELFTTADGRIMCAPFEYRGESALSGAVGGEEIAGTWGVIHHGNGTDYSNLVCAQEEEITFGADGTVSGAYSGTWSASESEPTINISIKVGDYTESYQGRFLRQYLEGTNVEALCFTAVDGVDKSLWGYKKAGAGQTFGDDVAVARAAHELGLELPTLVFAGEVVTLPTTIDGVGVTYSSSDETLLTNDGSVPATATDGSVTLKATLTCGGVRSEVSKTVKVARSLDAILPLDRNAILAHYADGTTFGTDPAVLVSEETGLSISFLVGGLTSDWTSILHSSDNDYRMYLSVLHYIGTNYFEHNAIASTAAQAAMSSEGKAPWQLFLGGTYFVTVSFNTDGSVGYYRDGVLMLTFDDTCAVGAIDSGTTTQKPSDVVKAVIEYYKSNKLTFDSAVSNLVVGYGVDYTPAALVETLPVEEGNVLGLYASNVFMNQGAPLSGVSESTGVSFSFLVSNVVSDWDVIGSSVSDKVYLHLSVVDYDGSHFYEHNAVASGAASSVMSEESKGAYQIFLDGTYYVTISYNPEGTVTFYRDGELMLTFSNETTVNDGTHTMSEVVSAVVGAYNAGTLTFSRAVTNVVVGYSVDYAAEKPNSLVGGEVEVDTWIGVSGSAVVVESAEVGEVLVFDISGRVVYSGVTSRVEGLASGMYVVRAGEVVKIVTIK